MFGECHAHIFMDGINYRRAAQLHRNGVQEQDIRKKLERYAALGITFLRDGGDALGVSERTARIAPEYGITYRTPLFAIHKNGHYGGIVGYGYDDWKDYRKLVLQVKEKGGNFIKLMFSGIMDFGKGGEVAEEPLPPHEIKGLIHIAHEEGFSVMAHVNGAKAVKAAVEGGVDSVEHGNFMDEECLYALAESKAIWVPTYVTITNLIGKGRFDDAVLYRLRDRQGKMIRKGFELGAQIALGSDAGAFGVMHGQGVIDEYREFQRLLGIAGSGDSPSETDGQLLERAELDARLQAAEDGIRRRF